MLGWRNDSKNSHSFRNLSTESVEARLAVGNCVWISSATERRTLTAQQPPFSSPLNTVPNAPLPMGLSLKINKPSDIRSLKKSTSTSSAA